MPDSVNSRPLAGPVIRSSDMDEVHQSATIVMNTHAMQVLHRRPEAEAEISQSASGALKLLRFTYRSAVDIRPEPLADFVAVHLPVQGTLVYSCNGHEYRVGSRAAAAISPWDDVRMRWSEDLSLRVLRIELAAVEARLRALTGDAAAGPITFRPVVDERRSATLLHVVEAFGLVVDGAQGTHASRLLADELEEAVISALLLDLPHSYSDRLGLEGGTASATVVKSVAGYCRTHYAESLTVADLAQVAHVSERTLFAAFRREYGTTPARWLRSFRLERAREGLLGGAHTPNVTALALAHGFGHVGRFAADYRRAYGESPSETLRRIRAR